MRINKYLAAAGLCSRRDAEQYVLDGRVTCNGEVIYSLATRIGETDRVAVDGKALFLPERTVVYAYHKPVGVTVSLADPKQKNLLADHVKDIPERVVPVGRLDKDSSGLLLLTNDGPLVHRLTHPSFQKEKVYEVRLNRVPKGRDIARFEQGILLDGIKTSPAKITRHANGLQIRMREGRNRQIRRMWALLGYEVKKLHRTEMDGIKLGDLPEGHFRKLSREERKGL